MRAKTRRTPTGGKFKKRAEESEGQNWRAEEFESRGKSEGEQQEQSSSLSFFGGEGA